MVTGDFHISDADNAVTVQHTSNLGSAFAHADGVIRMNTQANGVTLVRHRQVQSDEHHVKRDVYRAALELGRGVGSPNPRAHTC